MDIDYLNALMLAIFASVCFSENRGKTEFDEEMACYLIVGFLMLDVAGLLVAALVILSLICKGRWEVWKLTRLMEEEMEQREQARKVPCYTPYLAPFDEGEPQDVKGGADKSKEPRS